MVRLSIKCTIMCLGIIFLISIFMTQLLISEDAEVKAYEKFLEESERKRHQRQSDTVKQHHLGKISGEKELQHDKPVDWSVQFISGKEMVKVVEGEHKSIQIHQVTIQNLVDIDGLLQCRDSFSKFSYIIPQGESYEFSVTDIFHKRHYWCTVHFDKLVYTFRAYGEGAPRDNNHIILKKEGAFINGKDMTRHD